VETKGGWVSCTRESEGVPAQPADFLSGQPEPFIVEDSGLESAPNEILEIAALPETGIVELLFLGVFAAFENVAEQFVPEVWSRYSTACEWSRAICSSVSANDHQVLQKPRGKSGSTGFH